VEQVPVGELIDDALRPHAPSFAQGGHGFGPHASALAAEELEGRLRRESAGPGQGAIFIIELPPRGQGGREAMV
jgi:hypothetical protein